MKINYYKQDGSLAHQQDLTSDNMSDAHGMIVRCTMRNGDIREGYLNAYGEYPSRNGFCVGEQVYLETWTHLDEETHRLIGSNDTKYDMTVKSVPTNDIIRMDAILYSGPRWGGRLYNHFFLDISQEKSTQKTDV